MSSRRVHLLMHTSMGAVVVCLTDVFLRSQDMPTYAALTALCLSSSPRACPYPLQPRSTTSPSASSPLPIQELRSVRFYLQRRKLDSHVIVGGTAAAKYFHRFIFFSKNLDVAASKLGSVRFYLQQRQPDCDIMVAGKTAAKYFFHHFIYSSNSLDVAASKLNSLTADEFPRGASGYVKGSDPQSFFNQIDGLLEGTDQDKQQALQLLQDAKNSVS